MILAHMGAGGERVQAFDFMGKPVADKEIQRTIGDRRLGAEPFRAQPFQNVIGAKRAMLFQQNLENTPPLRREFQAIAFAILCGGINPFADAIRMVVTVKACGVHVSDPPIWGLICYVITYIKPANCYNITGKAMKKIFLGMSAGALLAGMAIADVPNVATDIPPVQSIVARVMEGVGAPDLIVRPGASPHGYALRVSEAAALERADLVFFISDGLTPWFEEVAEPLAKKAELVELNSIPKTIKFEFREGAVFDEHGDHGGHDDHGDHKKEGHDEHVKDGHDGHDHGDDKKDGHDGHDHGDHKKEGHDEHAKDGHDGHDHGDHKKDGHDEHAKDGHDDHGHDHSGTDPHTWLDPENGKIWMMAIAEKLAAIDPDNADAYRRNAAEGIAEIDAAVAKAKALLDPVKEGKFVTFHDAYQYYERRFDLHSLGAISLGDARKPGPGRVKEIRDAVREHGVACVFSEPQFNPGLVKTVFEGSTAKTGLLDPLGSKLAQGATLYPAIIEELAVNMASCLAAK